MRGQIKYFSCDKRHSSKLGSAPTINTCYNAVLLTSKPRVVELCIPYKLLVVFLVCMCDLTLHCEAVEDQTLPLIIKFGIVDVHCVSGQAVGSLAI